MRDSFVTRQIDLNQIFLFLIREWDLAHKPNRLEKKSRQETNNDTCLFINLYVFVYKNETIKLGQRNI